MRGLKAVIGILPICIYLTMIGTPSHARLTADESGMWALICSSGGAYLLNLETGERRPADGEEGDATLAHACHAVGRRSGHCVEATPSVIA